GAVVARFVHTEEVTGSNPVSPTQHPDHSGSAALPFAPKRSLVRTHSRRPSRSRLFLVPGTEVGAGSWMARTGRRDRSRTAVRFLPRTSDEAGPRRESRPRRWFGSDA